MVSQGLLGKFIQPASLGVGFDLPIPHVRFQYLEPGGKCLQFLRAQFGDGFLNLFKLAH